MISLRLCFYIFIWISYVFFISIYAPLGSDWQDWHSQRIINAVQYLELNGYLSSYGFTIWSDCVNCNLEASLWQDGIYVSTHSFSLLPYILVNYFFGSEVLINYSHLIDKTSIFFTGFLLSELSIIFFKNTRVPNFFVGTIIFSLFAMNPWTYKMIIAGWAEVYFVLFFMLGIYTANKNFYKLSIFLFFISGLFNFVWSFAIALFYLFIFLIPKLNREKIDIKNYLPSGIKYSKGGLVYFFALMFSCIIIIFLRLFAQKNIDLVSGSSMLERIGISGIDIHNGGILGALQFLGGNRITKCVYSYEDSIITSDLNLGIQAYNCILSISSLFFVSTVAIVGLFLSSRKFPEIRRIIVPLSFGLLFLGLLLQQSFSAHLMGYSYVFSILFSIGLSYYFFVFLSNTENISLRYIFAMPIFMGILILFLRVTMLT